MISFDLAAGLLVERVEEVLEVRVNALLPDQLLDSELIDRLLRKLLGFLQHALLRSTKGHLQVIGQLVLQLEDL